MSEYNKTILTNAGLSLIAKVNKGNTKFTVTKAATSADRLADKSITELQQLTELPSVMQYGIINDASDSVQDGIPVIGAELIFNNRDLTNSYNINAVGLFAKEEGQDKEILYAVSTAVTPEVMPDYKNKTLFKFEMTMFVVVGKADCVSVSVTEKGVVTQKQLEQTVASLPSKTDISNLYNKIENDAKTLVALNSPNGNNIYNTKINLDTYGTLGITKFLGCQLETTGQMDGFKKEATNLYGWIVNVSKWNGANQYEQTVYICDYGQGSQVFIRSKANASGNKVENFERIATDWDLAKLQDAVEKAGRILTINQRYPDQNGNFNLPGFENPDYRYIKGQTLDVDTIASPGIYALSDATVTSSINTKALDSVPGGLTKTGYMVVLYHDSKNIDQVMLINADKSTTDFVIATRCITSDGSSRPSFKRLLNTDDYNNLWNKISAVENKELVHHCDDLASGIEYSKANPNCIVATP